jgi:ketosteroid isomerase-like protein
MEPVETVLHFIECINARDPDRLVRMMTEDHVFIDSLDARVSGCENMRAGWRGQTPAAWLATVFGRSGSVEHRAGCPAARASP